MPASSQQSPTSGTRTASAPHSAQAIVTGSIQGRCSSCSPSRPAVARSRSSSREATTFMCPSGQNQNGSGRPQ